MDSDLNQHPILEICIDRWDSALAAEAGGADRLEVCGALALGGLTPSHALVEQCVQSTSLPTMMMIRPDEGDFCYSDTRLEVMRRDIGIAKELHVDGVVFGCLTASHEIDVAACAELLELARPLKTTFHRAFDLVRDPIRSLEQLIDLGFDHLLTSGLQSTALQGESLIAQLHEQAKDRIQIIAASGIEPQNVAELLESTGVRQVHASASRPVSGNPSPTAVSFGDQSRVTCAEKVKQLVKAIRPEK